jgi:hypothetical protein
MSRIPFKMSWLRRRHGYCSERSKQKINSKCRPGLQGRFLTCPIATSSEVFASALLRLLMDEPAPDLIYIKKILITFF